MNITEIQDELVRLEYPKLLPDHDPDIERYFYLRSTDHDADALAIYRNQLAPRYPDNEFRTWLLRAYRSRDPAFTGLLAKGRQMLAARLMERVKAFITYIAGKAESFNERDVYSTIKTAEGILRILPKDRYEAMALMERYVRYASALHLRESSVAKANELVQAYLTDNLLVVKDERQRRSEAMRYAREQEEQRLLRADYDSYLSQKQKAVEQSKREDERRSVSRPAPARKAPLIDLSTIVFSQQDLARIEIPAMRRIEDQVLAYCIKYWNMIYDQAFERILFLYSRKYGKKNYDIFMTIRRGRIAQHRDDEILSSVVSLLITGYYYSIQGDVYLMRSWNAVKDLIEKQAVQARPAQPSLPAAPVQAAPVKTVPAKPAQVKPVPLTPAPVKAAPVQVKPVPQIAPVMPAKTAAPKPEPAKTAVSVKTAPAQKPAKPARIKPTVPKKAPPAVTGVSVKPAPAQTPQAEPPRPAVSEPVPVKIAAPPKAAAPVVSAKIEPAKAPPAKPAQSAPAKTAPEKKPAVKPARVKPAVPAKPARQPKQAVPVPQREAAVKGSVSDRLKELSGRSYDVYQDRFFAKSKAAIRKVVGKKKGLFVDLPEEAENLVYGFLRGHYADPFMNWEDSAERQRLFSMGFDLPSIIPVIDECYKTL